MKGAIELSSKCVYGPPGSHWDGHNSILKKQEEHSDDIVRQIAREQVGLGKRMRIHEELARLGVRIVGGGA